MKAGDFRAVFQLLVLGYWDQMNQSERALLMQTASPAAGADSFDRAVLKRMAPQVGLEPTTLRLTVGSE